MSNLNQPSPKSTGRRSCLSCCGISVAVPVLLTGYLWVSYVAHNRPPEIVIPTNPVPANNAYDDFVRASILLKSIQHKPPASMRTPPPESEILAATRSCSEDAAPGLAMLRGGLNKPFMWPSVRSAIDPSFKTMSLMREAERVITGDAEYRRRSGHPGKAADSLLDGIEMGAMLPRGGGVIQCLVGTACSAIALKSLEPILPELSPDELKHVANRFDRIATKRVSYSDVAMEEAQVSTAIFLEDLRQHSSLGDRYKEISEMVGVDQGKMPTIKQGSQIARYLMADKARLLTESKKFQEAVAREALSPYAGPSRVPVPTSLQEFDFLAPVFSQARASYEASGATIELLRAEVALYRFKADHGRYPKQLNQLVPSYMKNTPMDPLGGGANKPLKYSTKDNGSSYLLYSLGPDLTDDGGRPARFPTTPGGDIVAQHLWPVKPRAGSTGSVGQPSSPGQ